MKPKMILSKSLFFIMIIVVVLQSCAPAQIIYPLLTTTITVTPTYTLSYTPKPTNTHLQTNTPTETPISSDPMLIPAVKECFDSAITQGAMNSCAALARQIAETDLEKTLSQIILSDENDRNALDQLQSKWINQVEADCQFFYRQQSIDESGNYHSGYGSVAPMLQNMCIARQYEQRKQELIWAYLSPGGG